MTRRSKKRPKPLSAEYRFVVIGAGGRRRRIAGVRTQKREAIRESHRGLHRIGAGANASVKTHEGALIYQAHLSPLSGRIVAEEL